MFNFNYHLLDQTGMIQNMYDPVKDDLVLPTDC